MESHEILPWFWVLILIRFNFSTDATSQLDGSSSIFQNQHDDGDQSDFVDYGWDNIGSFDDLDRIFR